MNNKFKEIDIKNRTYFFFNDIINVTNRNPTKIKTDEKSYKILIYYIGYVAIKDLRCIKINSVNPLYLITDKIIGHTEESN